MHIFSSSRAPTIVVTHALTHDPLALCIPSTNFYLPHKLCAVSWSSPQLRRSSLNYNRSNTSSLFSSTSSAEFDSVFITLREVLHVVLKDVVRLILNRSLLSFYVCTKVLLLCCDVFSESHVCYSTTPVGEAQSSNSTFSSPPRFFGSRPQSCWFCSAVR